MDKSYKHMSSEEKNKLAKEIAVRFLSDRIEQYEFVKASEEEVKRIINCKATQQTVLGSYDLGNVLYLTLGKNFGYEGLDTRIHEILDAILVDPKLFGGQLKKRTSEFAISHKRIHEIAEQLVSEYRSRPKTS